LSSDERVTVDFLVKLAVIEPGENWQGNLFAHGTDSRAGTRHDYACCRRDAEWERLGAFFVVGQWCAPSLAVQCAVVGGHALHTSPAAVFAAEVPNNGVVTLTYFVLPHQKVMRTRIKLEGLTMCTFVHRNEDGTVAPSSGEGVHKGVRAERRSTVMGDVLSDVKAQVLRSDLSVPL
jgi:hypothetical protein